ncbi:DUF1642 domain-containing protein [Desemzia sp. RIT804]|uniref:DUF1642 domain-containing protein n=1 Tax=Desemzia sp. RIT 804 TaxID=2810209 RepID=UPI00194F3F27|nr:DUF1642 domain-containing protein [Desemzia sp. RIT 804]MBM6615609.1 DUF1642 domain-containing protein [Desemzia sp. RIT 804]
MKKDKEWLKRKLNDIGNTPSTGNDNFDEGFYKAFLEIEKVVHQLEETDQYDQIEKLANFIMEHVPGEPSKSEGAVEVAIRLLSKQEKPVIPKFVANYIEKEKNSPYPTLANAYHNSMYNNEVSEWLQHYADSTYVSDYAKADKNQKLFTRAWYDGFSVEKEKRYYVYDKATKSYLGYNAVRTQLNWWTSRLENESFTEQEIKAIDERFWTFREEVEA